MACAGPVARVAHKHAGVDPTQTQDLALCVGQVVVEQPRGSRSFVSIDAIEIGEVLAQAERHVRGAWRIARPEMIYVLPMVSRRNYRETSPKTHPLAVLEDHLDVDGAHLGSVSGVLVQAFYLFVSERRVAIVIGFIVSLKGQCFIHLLKR